MNREYQRVTAGTVVEYHLGRRIGEDAAVPIIFTVDTDGWKRRRQRSGSHDMRGTEFRLAAVEIVHHAGAHVRGTDCKSWRSCVDDRKVHQLGEGLPERRGRIESGAVHPQWDLCSPERRQMRLKKSRNTSDKGRPVRPGVRNSFPSRHEWP